MNQIMPRTVIFVTRPIGPLVARHGVTSPAPWPPVAARPGIFGSTGRPPSLRQEHKEACVCRQCFGVRRVLAAKNCVHSTSDLSGYSTFNDRPFNHKVCDLWHFISWQVWLNIAGLCILGFGFRSRVGYDFSVVAVLGTCRIFHCDDFHLDHVVGLDAVVVIGVGLRNGREKLRIFWGSVCDFCRCTWFAIYLYPWCLWSVRG